MRHKTLTIFVTIIIVAFFLFDVQNFAQAKPKKPKDKKEHKEGKEYKEHKEHGPPPWAPAHGYRRKTRYIYFPERETYYDIDRGVYIRYEGQNWEVSAKIPLPLQSVNLEKERKIELGYSGDDVQVHFEMHKKQYK